jgi:pSer/pThr/pTyr-binding forkhead associated (FHA) protein
VLRDNNTQGGTIVNDERVSPGNGEGVLLRDGDRIRIAGRTLIFHERFTQRRRAPAPKDVAAPTRPASSSAAAPGSVPPSLADSLPPVMAGRGGGNGNGVAAPMVPPPAPSSSGGDAPRLVAVAGPHAGATFPVGRALANGSLAIGRDPNSDIALPDDSKTSRLHARLVRDGAGYAIEDAGSTNGTYVNGAKISRQTLVSGDTVLVGGTALRFE